MYITVLAFGMTAYKNGNVVLEIFIQHFYWLDFNTISKTQKLYIYEQHFMPGIHNKKCKRQKVIGHMQQILDDDISGTINVII